MVTHDQKLLIPADQQFLRHSKQLVQHQKVLIISRLYICMNKKVDDFQSCSQ